MTHDTFTGAWNCFGAVLRLISNFSTSGLSSLVLLFLPRCLVCPRYNLCRHLPLITNPTEALQSPPTCGSPQVTAEPSANKAQKAKVVARISCTPATVDRGSKWNFMDFPLKQALKRWNPTGSRTTRKKGDSTKGVPYISSYVMGMVIVLQFDTNSGNSG